jgi:hypothetical protein
MAELGDAGGNLVADLVKPGVGIALWLGDGTTARLRVIPSEIPLEQAIPITLRAARQENRAIQVDSLDIKGSASQPSGSKLFVMPEHVVAFVITEELNPNALD